MRPELAVPSTLAIVFAAAMTAHTSPVQLSPAMEATIRAVIEEQLEKHPEMKFNVTRLREMRDKVNMQNSTNDDTVCCLLNM